MAFTINQPVSSQPAAINSASQCQLPPSRVPSRFHHSLSQQLLGARIMPSAAVVVLIVVAAGCAFNPCLATPVGAPPPPPAKHPRHSFLTLVRAASIFQPPLSHSYHTKSGISHHLSPQSYNLGHRPTLEFSPLVQRHVGMGEPDAGGGSGGEQLILRKEENSPQQQQQQLNSLLATSREPLGPEGGESLDTSSSSATSSAAGGGGGAGFDSRVPWSKRAMGSGSLGSSPADESNPLEGGQGEDAMVDGLQQVGASLASNFLRQGRSGVRNYDIPQIECPPAEDQMERFPCPSPDRMGRYRCIDDHVLCDGFIDCPNGEDEEMQQCMFYKTTKAHLDVIADAIIRFIRGRK